MSVKLTDRTADIAVCVVLLALGAASLPYLWHYSEEVAFTAVRANDELAFMRVVEQLLAPGLNIDYFKTFNTFGYGAIWWAIIAVAAAPFKLLGSEQGMVITIRLLSLVSSLAGFYFAYAAVRQIVTRRLDVFVAAVALIVVCFFTQLVFINSTYIHPETMYSAALMLAFYQLVQAQGQFNRNFYWSIVWLIAAASIKLLAALFGVAYLVFWWLGPRNLDRRTLLKIAGVVLATALVLNPWLLHPELLRDAVSTTLRYSVVTRTGWPELHFTWTLSNSISYFSSWYIVFGALLAVLSLGLVTAGFLWGGSKQAEHRSQTGRLFFMSFAVVTAYSAFSLFYTWQPVHYGIALIYFIPVLVVSMFAILPVFRAPSGAMGGWRACVLGSSAVVLFMAGLLLVQKDSIVGVYNLVTHPAGGPTQLARKRAIQKVRDVLEGYQGPMGYLGVAHDLAVPLIKGQRIPYWHLNALPVDMVGKSDLLVFWKPDYAYDMKYMKREPTDPATFETFNRIRDGGTFSAEGKTVAFKKFFEDNELEFYARTETMAARSTSTSRRHHADRAFDGSTEPDYFWEAEGPFPHLITVSYPVDQPVASYQLSVGELEKRMPRAWQFEGSRDGQTWVVLDRRAGEKPWTPSETRTYSLKSPASYRYYQFTFSEGYEPNILRIYEIRLQ